MSSNRRTVAQAEALVIRVAQCCRVGFWIELVTIGTSPGEVNAARCGCILLAYAHRKVAVAFLAALDEPRGSAAVMSEHAVGGWSEET